MKKLFLICGLVFGAFGSAGSQSIHRPEQEQETASDRVKPFMRAKLDCSQSVLDGLVTENFDLIYRGAAEMKKMSEAAQWPRAADPVYDHFGEEFRNQSEKLMQLADQKNLEGTHFTYLSMTTTCINCHNYVRRAFRVEPNRVDPQGPVRLIPTEWEGRSLRSHDSLPSAVKHP